jgi:RNA polymerase II subunit A C-terminal domain phosphatase
MLIRAPQSLHYPITITALRLAPKDIIERSTPLFSYSFRSTTTVIDQNGEEKQLTDTYPAEFRSENEGTLIRWLIQKGDVITEPG